jgi:hypothetical protein
MALFPKTTYILPYNRFTVKFRDIEPVLFWLFWHLNLTPDSSPNGALEKAFDVRG